jgi:hypothetical protein
VDQLLTSGDVAIRVVAIAVCVKARLQEHVTCETTVGCVSLKIGKLAERAIVSAGGIGESVAGERRCVVTVYAPTQVESNPKLLGQV